MTPPLLALLLIPLHAAEPETAAPAASTATASVVVSTEAAAAQERRKLENLIKAKIHKDAADWEPVSVRAGGDPAEVKTRFSRRVKTVRVKGKQTERGEPSKATAAALVHKVKDDKMLVVSVYPDSLKRLRKHLEVRYFLVEGFLEEVKVAAVTLTDGSPKDGARLDSFGLQSQGIPFQEEFPASAEVRVAALDPRPGKAALNAATVRLAAFGDRDLGFVNLGYSVTGLSAGSR